MIILNQDFSNRGIKIQPYGNSPDEHVAYDLRVGKIYQEPGDANLYQILDKYILRTGRCILVTTQETITVPENVFGQLYSKGSLSALGLMVGNTKVDPLFSGQLNIAVFNAGDRPISIVPEMRFCSIIFGMLEHPIPDGSARYAPKMQAQKKSIFGKFIGSYRIEIVTIIICGLTAFAATLATMYFGK